MDQAEREAWLAERRKGMGGTDVAAIMMSGADSSEKLGSFENSLFKLWSEKLDCIQQRISTTRF